MTPEQTPLRSGWRRSVALWLGGFLLLFGLIFGGRYLLIERALSRAGAVARRLGQASRNGLPEAGRPLRYADALLWLLEPAPEEPAVSPAPERTPSVNSAGPVRRLGPTPSAVVVLASETVLRLAEAGAMPRGVVRSETGNLPAGIEILNGAGLGIGWFPGDRLVLVDGIPALDRTQVVREVLERRARRESVITATVARLTQSGVATYQVLVEQPYLAAPAEAPVDAPVQP